MSEIFSEEFKSYEEARSKIDSFNFGQITESEFGNQTLEILDQDFVVIQKTHISNLKPPKLTINTRSKNMLVIVS